MVECDEDIANDGWNFDFNWGQHTDAVASNVCQGKHEPKHVLSDEPENPAKTETH